MKRGDAAREKARDAIIAIFKSLNAFAGIQDKKIYVNLPDGPDGSGEVLQFAISMTMPKTPITFNEEEFTELAENASKVLYTLSEEDMAILKELKERLGITD